MLRIFVLIIILFGKPVQHFSQEINQIDDKGYKQGEWRKTYSDGSIRYEGQFNNDKPYGEFRYYYENSAINAITVFSSDGVVARTRTYFENGKMMAEGNYINQLKDSTWRFYSDIKGELVAEEDFFDGKLNGQSITYYPETGQIAELIEYKEDVKDGKYVKYFSDGNTLIEGSYRNGQLEGEYAVYYPNGMVEVKGTFKEGLKTGSWSYFSEDGRQLTEDEHQQERKEE